MPMVSESNLSDLTIAPSVSVPRVAITSLDQTRLAAFLVTLVTLLAGCASTDTSRTGHARFDHDSTSLTAKSPSLEADNQVVQATLVTDKPQTALIAAPISTAEQQEEIVAAAPAHWNPVAGSPVAGNPQAGNQRTGDIDETLTTPVDQSHSITLDDIVSSIHATFPLLEAAYMENQIAAGNQTEAWGAFDTSLKASSENGPLGFYETYRHSAGVSKPIYQGGQLFGGYRVGRGDFQPWYLERQTNEGGELKAGIRVPLLKNRDIDARRAELWRATYERQRAQPEIRSMLIQFVRDGSIAYWDWIAARRQYEVGQQALALAVQRNNQLERKVELGDLDPPVLQDNLRAIAEREAKLIGLRRKLQQASVKLSLYYRTDTGEPLVPNESLNNEFPTPSPISESLETDIQIALEQRPEIASLNAQARRVRVDISEARNDMLPKLDAQLAGSQDFGEPTSSKRDKSQFELEAGVFMEVPVQRRKAIGKSRAAQGKLMQIDAKRRFTEDKIRVEIQATHAGLTAALERLEKARESKRLAEYMADVERRKFDLGESDLLSVVLREQYAIEAAYSENDALFEYFSAKADFDAAMARDWPTR